MKKIAINLAVFFLFAFKAKVFKLAIIKLELYKNEVKLYKEKMMRKFLKYLTAALVVSIGISGAGLVSVHADSASVNNTQKISSKQNLQQQQPAAPNNGTPGNGAANAVQQNQQNGTAQAGSVVSGAQNAGSNAANSATQIAGSGVDIPNNPGGLNDIAGRINALITSGGSKVVVLVVIAGLILSAIGVVWSALVTLWKLVSGQGWSWRWLSGLAGAAVFFILVYFVANATLYNGQLMQVVSWVLQGHV